jgi:zinc protease
MTIRKNRMMLSAAAILCATVLAGAQRPAATTPTQAAPLTSTIPADPEITQGQLPNGLRYYVRANKKPEHRAELRLVVKAGSVLEDDDQQGLAHFVEHMAFNGTEHFPKQAVVQMLESLGMRFGADINAYTSFDETVFMLQVPTEKPETMDRSLLILEDWAHHVSFESAAIDKERGVVTEEWRRSRGAGARVRDKMFPILLKGSRYADRIPIGKTEIIQGFKPERLKQFYADWYRPDLMAVVAVGDFNKTDVENLIKAHFASMPEPAAPRPRPAYGMPDHAGSVYAIMTDKEMTSTSVEVDNLLAGRPQGTVGVYRQEIVDRLFASMLSARFSEISQKPDAPFVMAFANRRQFFERSKDDASLVAMVKEDGIERGLEALLGEAERVSRFGFTATELDRAKQSTLRARERLLAETGNRESASRADEYVRNFIEQEPLPTGQEEFEMHQRFLPEITLNEVNQLAKEWFPDRNRLVIVNAPEKPGLVVPDESKLTAVMKAASAKDLKPYVDTVDVAALLDAVPAPGAIVKTATKDAAGITEWELSNGVKVVLKPTTFKEDEIVFRASSPGGTSLASDQDYIPASTATQVVTAGGLGKFNAIDLRKVLSGKIASAVPVIGELEEGMNGSGSRKDLETMFQLIYLRFTQPRADPTIFGVMTSQMKTMLANQTASPEYAFAQMLTSTLSQNHPRRRLPTVAAVDEWNLDKSMAFYKDRFADASDFTFVFVGSFDLPTMKPLVERYLGGLPSIHREETWKDVGVRMPTGIIEKTVEKGIEPKSTTAIVFSGPFEYNQTNRVAIRAMAEMLQSRLLETIREELGGTYSITVNAAPQKFPNPQYAISIQFGSDPQRTAGLDERIFQEIERLKTSGPTEKQVNDEREALLKEFETRSKENGYLLGQLALRYQYGEDPAALWNIPEYYKKIDAPMIQQAAKTYLNMENRVRVTLVPAPK